MMQIPRAFATCTILIAMGLALQASAASVHLRVTLGDWSNLKAPEPIEVSIPTKLFNDAAFTLPKQAEGKLWWPTNKDLLIPVQLNAAGDDTIARFVLPAGQKNAPSELILSTDSTRSVNKPEQFGFVDGDGFRDLVFGDQKITRDMIKWDPNDRANTFKPFTHVYAFNGDGYITKGPGGLYTHHRGIFFGFKTQYGDFWHCPDVHQEHEKYVAEDEFTGPIVAREVATTLWKDKEDKPVVRDTRDVKTWRIAPDQLVLDYDITVESLKGPIDLGGDPHHAGFHFRADNEVAGAAQKAGQVGLAKYVRPTSATSRPNDFWDNESWVACLFTVRDQPYVVVHMDAPTNPRPIVYSTRSYGRFGSFFTGKVDEGKPLHLKYRLLIMNGAKGLASSEDYAALFHNFASPVKVTVEAK